MISYPAHFKTELLGTSGVDQTWSTRAAEHEVTCCVPKEFEGPGGDFSPEDLYVMALANCLMATFKVYAHHSRLSFGQIKISSQLTVDLDENRKPWMQAAHFDVQVTQASNPEMAKRLVDRAFKSGFILNSVKTALSLNYHE